MGCLGTLCAVLHKLCLCVDPQAPHTGRHPEDGQQTGWDSVGMILPYYIILGKATAGTCDKYAEMFKRRDWGEQLHIHFLLSNDLLGSPGSVRDAGLLDKSSV